MRQKIALFVFLRIGDLECYRFPGRIQLGLRNASESRQGGNWRLCAQARAGGTLVAYAAQTATLTIEITEIEQSILEGLLRIILNDLRATWSAVAAIEFSIEAHETEPQLLQILAPNDQGAYDYLPASVMQFPDGQAMLDLLAARGLTEVRQYPLTFGIATLYVGVKPGGSPHPVR